MKLHTLLLLASLPLVALAATPESQKIDKFINASLKEQKIFPTAQLDDHTFLRRIYLDVIGRIPTPEESASFLAKEDPDKRDQLIDQLLNSEGYVSHFYNYWADILRINNRLQQSGNDAEYAYRHWLKDSLRENKGYDQMTREMVSARGHIWENGAVGYYQRDRGMALDNMSNTVRVFLGTRLECAQCHDHPFDKWTQMDYFQMAAFSNGMDARGYGGDSRSMVGSLNNQLRVKAVKKATGIEKFPVQRDKGRLKKYVESKNFPKYLERHGIKDKKEFVRLNEKAIAAYKKADQEVRKLRRVSNDMFRPIQYTEVSAKVKPLKLPHDYQYDDADPHEVVKPKTMFGLDIDMEKLTDQESTIDAYAEWMASKENPTFTRVIVNRLWKKVYGVGLIEPVDDLSEHTVASHPKLLTHLEQRMKELDYDMKAFLGELFKSDTYQRQAYGEEILGGVPFYFPGPKLKRMTAEQIWDSLAALSIPGVDQYQPTFASQLARIENSRQIYEALNERSEDEFKDMLKGLYKSVGEKYVELDRLRTAVYKAKADENLGLAKKLSDEVRQLTNEARREVTRVAHKTMERGKVDGSKLIAGLGMQAMSAGAMGDSMMGEDTQVVLTSLPKIEKPKVPEGLNKNQKRNWEKRMKFKIRGWQGITKGLMRASEMQSPAPRGHFLREFGQSDRETIENSHAEASVPQALNLLNSHTVEILANPFSILGRTLEAADSPEAAVGAIFRAMLTREPTEAEVARLAPRIAEHKENGQRDIIWAILNTQQMIFVQ